MTESKRGQVLAGVAAALGAVAYFTIGREAESRYVVAGMADIHNQVATDAVAQYDIAKRQGDAMQACVQAGMVSAAWLQAKDEAEKADCAGAGTPAPSGFDLSAPDSSNRTRARCRQASGAVPRMARIPCSGVSEPRGGRRGAAPCGRPAPQC
jgi:hypothetical protein